MFPMLSEADQDTVVECLRRALTVHDTAGRKPVRTRRVTAEVVRLVA